MLETTDDAGGSITRGKMKVGAAERRRDRRETREVCSRERTCSAEGTNSSESLGSSEGRDTEYLDSDLVLED